MIFALSQFLTGFLALTKLSDIKSLNYGRKVTCDPTRFFVHLNRKGYNYDCWKDYC